MRTPLQINVTYSPCTSTSPVADLQRQHNVDNDPSIKFLIATSVNKDDSLTTTN